MDFGLQLNQANFWETMGAIMFLQIMGYATKHMTVVMLAGVCAAAAGMGYAGIMIAGILTVVFRLIEVITVR